MGFGVSFVQSTHHFTVHDHKQTGGILLGEHKQPKGTRPRETTTLGVRRKVELRLQRADRQQTKQDDQEEDQGDQGREEEKVWCILSESVDSICLEIHIAMYL